MNTDLNSGSQPHFQIPESIVQEYATKLESLYGLPEILFDSPLAILQTGLLLEHWQGIIALKAHLYEPRASMVRAGTPRAALIQALRAGSSVDILLAVDACKAADGGLAEIQERMDGLRRFCGLDS